MKIAIIDPGCSGPQGHNGAMFEEFARALPAAGYAPAFYVSRSAAAGALAAPGVTVRRPFSIDGYADHGPILASEAAFSQSLAMIEGELRTIAWDDVEAVLMPTAYPLHLIALGRVLPTVLPPDRVAVAVGLLMPVSFWAPQPEIADALGAMMLTALEALRHHGPTLAYSETGSFAFGATRLELPRLLPPVAPATAELLAQHLARQPDDPAADDAALAGTDAPAGAAAAPAPDAPPGAARGMRFGFFGSPFTSKGINLLRDAAAQAVAAGAWDNELHVVLPDNQARVAGAFDRMGPGVHASSRERGNAEFLAAMAAVDVVLLPYDPAHYGDKLSGVLFEAIALGKPVVVTDGCTPMLAWLEQHAPGTYVACPYDAAALAEVLRLPAAAVQPLGHAARASAPLVAQLKSMRRYLAAAGIRDPQPRAPALQLVASRSDATPPDDASAAAEAPIVSIVIPAWRRETMIEAAIESALAQTVRQIEVIVVDNDSPDQTEAVARRVAARDPRVRVYRNPENVGPVRNWIEGLRRARAPFVKLLFSDDLIDPQFVQRMLPPLLDPTVAFSVCQAIVGEQPWQGRRFYAAFDDSTMLSRQAFETLSLSQIGCLPLSPGAGLFRRADLLLSLRTHLQGVRDYDFSATGSGVDWLSYLLTAQRYPRVAYVAEPLAFFRAHPDSLTIADRDGHVWRGYQLAAAWFKQVAAAA